jgi:probable rRNA maturation factor
MKDPAQAWEATRAAELQHAGLIDPDQADWLGQSMTRLLPMAAPGLRRLTVRLVQDAQMCAMHERHMHDPATTDVLTFVDGHEADVAVCVDEARRRAAELGHPLERELLLYALHGMLHAAGMDDRTPEDFARMHAEEDRLLAAIGLEPTFRPRGDAA